MTKKSTPNVPPVSIFYADDKDIFDLLMSSPKTMTQRSMRQILRRRGVLVSHQDKTEDLAEFISLFYHDRKDLVELMKAAKPKPRADKKTNVRLAKPYSDEEVLEALATVEQDRKKHGEVFDTIKQNDRFVVKIDYEEFDYSSNYLKQRVPRKLHIEVINENGFYLIRHSAQDRCRDIVRALLQAVKGSSAVKVEKVEMPGVKDPDLRTKFFTQLISSVEGCPLKNVVKTKVEQHLDATQHNTTSDEDPESQDSDADNNDSDEPSVAMAGAVNKVLMSGSSIHHSREYQALIQQGFYISRITWEAEIKAADGQRLLTFEALFEDSIEFKQFVYKIRKFQKVKEDGTYGFDNYNFTKAERDDYSTRLDSASRKALASVKAGVGGEP